MPRKSSKQAVKTAPAKHYGDTARAVAQQRSIPLPAAPGPPPVAAAGPSAGSAAAPGGAPFPGAPQVTPLDAPTNRRGEPFTQGSPFGPGQGPEALGLDDGSGMIRSQLRALFQQHPSGELADLIAEAENGR